MTFIPFSMTLRGLRLAKTQFRLLRHGFLVNFNWSNNKTVDDNNSQISPTYYIENKLTICRSISAFISHNCKFKFSFCFISLRVFGIFLIMTTDNYTKKTQTENQSQLKFSFKYIYCAVAVCSVSGEWKMQSFYSERHSKSTSDEWQMNCDVDDVLCNVKRSGKQTWKIKCR